MINSNKMYISIEALKVALEVLGFVSDAYDFKGVVIHLL